MNLKLRLLLCGLMILISFFSGNRRLLAQGHEVGISIVLSGHILFGPYYRYWINDHHELEAAVLGAWEENGKIYFPNAFNAGYRYYALENHWRPSIGAQYSLLVSPRQPEGREKLHLVSVVPGMQYRFGENKYGVEELVWITYMKLKGKHRVLPIGLDSRLGMKF